jgi:hypothetical protein
LPVPYFHLVFTLPHALNGSSPAIPRTLYELLFAASGHAHRVCREPAPWLGGRPAFSLVLHTWKQDLGPACACACPGGRRGADAGRGVGCSRSRGFLFPVRALSKVFRGKFIAALERERTGGKAALTSLDRVRLAAAVGEASIAHEWVVYAKQPLGGPAQVLEYLGRYTHRVAISNERIVGIEQDAVAFRVRDNGAGGKRRVLRLPGAAFIARFLLHVLPQRLQAHPPLWLARPGAQARRAGGRARSLAGARARTGRNRVGRRLHAPRGAPRVVLLSAVPADASCRSRQSLPQRPGSHRMDHREATRKLSLPPVSPKPWRIGLPEQHSPIPNNARHASPMPLPPCSTPSICAPSALSSARNHNQSRPCFMPFD